MSFGGQPGKSGGGATPASPPLQSGPDRVTVRLELLRLAHRADLTAEQIIERAEVLGAWVLDPAADKGARPR